MAKRVPASMRTRQSLSDVIEGRLFRAAERWRAVKVTEFERRQLAAIRQDLDQEYETSTGLKMRNGLVELESGRADRRRLGRKEPRAAGATQIP